MSLLRISCSVAFGLCVACAPEADGSGATEGASESGGTSSGAPPAMTTIAGDDDDDATTAAASDDAPPSDSTGEPPNATSDDGTTGAPPQACPERGLPPGHHTSLTLEHDGLERSYDVYVPAGYTGDEPVPLVFDFHGYLGSPGGQFTFSQIMPAADAAGTVIVLPAGEANSWNGGMCCGEAAANDLDDVGFVRALVEAMATQVCFDPDRVFAMGMSNGGYMSNRLGCEAADIFAAIGPVAGMIMIPFDECQPSRPVPVMHFHGTADLIVPYDGNVVTGYPSVADSMAVWVDRNGCTDAAPTITYEQGDVVCETWSACEQGSEVTLCTIEGAGHCWPGNVGCPFGTSTADISATNELLAFFAAHPMP